MKTLLDGFGEATDEVIALRAEVKRLRAELARYKPAICGRIYPVPEPGALIIGCARPVDHDGPHQAGDKIWAPL